MGEQLDTCSTQLRHSENEQCGSICSPTLPTVCWFKKATERSTNMGSADELKQQPQDTARQTNDAQKKDARPSNFWLDAYDKRSANSVPIPECKEGTNVFSISTVLKKCFNRDENSTFNKNETIFELNDAAGAGLVFRPLEEPESSSESAPNDGTNWSTTHERSYGLKIDYENKDTATYMRASVSEKEGTLDKIFAEEPLFQPQRISPSTPAERDVWRVGAFTAGQEHKIFEDQDLELWLGAGLTVHTPFDADLKDVAGEHPTTVFTNFKLKF